MDEDMNEHEKGLRQMRDSGGWREEREMAVYALRAIEERRELLAALKHATGCAALECEDCAEGCALIAKCEAP